MDDVDAAAVVRARQVLHAVAEHLLAGPQHRRTGEIALAVTGQGFATTHPVADDVQRLEVSAAGVRSRPAGVAVPMGGTVRELATALGIGDPGPPQLYPDHAELGPDDDLAADPATLALVLDAFRVGDAAMRDLDPTQTPILWPEHFDVGISLAEVNYGLSPGDAAHDLPYAYVGPWAPRPGDFWNEPFGASRPLAGLGGADAVLEFFRAGRDRAAGS